MGGGTGTGDAQRFRDDLLQGGVYGHFYASQTEPDVVYLVEGVQKSASTGDQWAVRRIPYSFNGRERSEKGATKTLVDCMEDVRIFEFIISDSKKRAKKR